MSQADKNYSDLLSRCVEPGVANNWFTGFSGSGTYRTRYASEYNSKCRTDTGEKKPTTSVFTPELIKEMNDLNKSYASAPKTTTPAPTKKDDKKDDKDDDKKKDGTTDKCPNNMKGYVFCDHKFKKANILKGSSETTETSWKGCRQRCWDKGVECRGWSWREGSGTCQMFDVGGKDKMIYQKWWASGPRSKPNTSQGAGDGSSSSSSTGSGTNTNTSTDTNPSFYYPAPDTREWWQKDDIISGVENWVIIAAVCCLVVVIGGGMMMMMMML